MKNFVIFFILTLLVYGEVNASRGISVTLKASEHPEADTYGQVSLYEKYYALVIGIDAYNNGWPVLNNAVSDAEKISEALQDKGIEVTKLINPNSIQLKSSLEEFYVIKGNSPERGLIVWYAGHGHTIDGEGYLVPTDAPRDTENTLFKLRSLSLRRFGEYVRQAKAKHALAIFDSCFAGTVFSTQRALPPSAITLSTTYPVRQFISSGDAHQTVSDDGAFANLFLQAINGESLADGNLDGYLTGTELGLFLSDRVTNLTQSVQTPRYGKIRDPKYDQGDFVFVIPNTNPANTSLNKKQETRVVGKINAKEIALWGAIKNSRNPEDFKAYLSEYPEGIFASLAKMKQRSIGNYYSFSTVSGDTTNGNKGGYIGTVLKSSQDWGGLVLQLNTLTAASIGEQVVIKGENGFSKPFVIKRTNNGKAFAVPQEGSFQAFEAGKQVFAQEVNR